MRRLKKHQGNLNRILKDERISGSRRLLAQTIATWLDADNTVDVLPGMTERKIISLVLIGTFGPSSNRIWWKDDDEQGVQEPINSALDKETLKQIKDAYGHLMGGQ